MSVEEINSYVDNITREDEDENKPVEMRFKKISKSDRHLLQRKSILNLNR